MADDLKELEVIAYEISSASPRGLYGILRIKVSKESQFITIERNRLAKFLSEYMESGGYETVKLINRTKNSTSRVSLATLRDLTCQPT